jgi:hypothetical protein
MKRTQVFTFIMAIVWTLIGGFVIFYASRGGLNGKGLLLIMLAVVPIALNWMLWIRTR